MVEFLTHHDVYVHEHEHEHENFFLYKLSTVRRGKQEKQFFLFLNISL